MKGTIMTKKLVLNKQELLHALMHAVCDLNERLEKVEKKLNKEESNEK